MHKFFIGTGRGAVRQPALISGLLTLRAGVADIGALCKISPIPDLWLSFFGEKVGGGILHLCSDFLGCRCLYFSSVLRGMS